MSVVERAAAALDAARAAFADADALARLSDQDVVDLLALTADLTRVVDAQRVRLAGAVATRSATSTDTAIHRMLGARHDREALSRAFGIRGREAAELITMSAATSASVSMTGETIAIKFPRVAQALDAGDLSLAQARAIVHALAPAAPRADLSQLAWAEGCLVDEAVQPERRLAPELLVTQARAYVAVLDPDGVLPNSERQRAMRSLRMRQLPDGMWELVMRCTPETAAAIKAVLDASTSPRVRVRFTDDPSVAADEAQGDAEADAEIDAAPGRDAGTEASDEGTADEADMIDTDPAASTAPASPADDRTRAQKAHDAAVAIFEAHAAAGAAPLAGGEVPRLVLTGTIEAFDAYLLGREHPQRYLTIEHTGAPVPIETADRLLCNAVVQRAVVDSRGHVLDLGREQRTFNRAQRRALAAKYGGCATPGCGFPVAWTEAHHATWWQHGGRTDVDNGILLCSHCHHEVHAGRLLVIGEPGDWRVVANLRPADRYARSSRIGARLQPGTSATPLRVPSAVLSANAPAPLAVRLPDAVAAALDAFPNGPAPMATSDASAAAADDRRGTGDASPAAPAVSRPPTSHVPRPRRRRSLVEARLRRRWALQPRQREPRRSGPRSRAVDLVRLRRHPVLRAAPTRT